MTVLQHCSVYSFRRVMSVQILDQHLLATHLFQMTHCHLQDIVQIKLRMILECSTNYSRQMIFQAFIRSLLGIHGQQLIHWALPASGGHIEVGDQDQDRDANKCVLGYQKRYPKQLLLIQYKPRVLLMKGVAHAEKLIIMTKKASRKIYHSA